MDLQLAGKVAIVTGATGPLGRATALVLAQEGASVVMAARTQATLDAAVAQVQAQAGGGSVTGLLCDVTNDASVEDMVDEVVRRFGSVDILVHSAAPSVRSGGASGANEALPDREAFNAEMDVKLFGAVRCVRAVAPHMEAAGWGRIVLLSGTNARNSGSAAGSMRNASVIALAKNLADEYGPKGINVSTVNPGIVKTEKTPGRAQRLGMTLEAFEASVGRETAIGRMVTGEEVAWVIAFMCSPKSVSIAGDVVTVSGGAGKAIYY